jgi:hypothetical protein
VTDHFARSDIDDLIDRAAAALSVSGVEPDDVIEAMIEDGVDPSDAFLATRAAAMMTQTREALESLPYDEDEYAANVRKKAWVETLLTKRDKIERAIGMPLGTMLGCGHWGCVFESTPPWVVKLSIDPTEGPIWSKIAGLMRDEQWGLQGFPEIKSIHRITPDLVTPGGRKKKVWAIVRENVVPVFKEYKARDLGHHGGGTLLATSPYTMRYLGLDQPEEVHSLYFGTSLHARSAESVSGPAGDLGQAIDGLLKYRRLAGQWHDLDPRRRSRVARITRTTMIDGQPLSREDLEYRINRVVETMFNGPACAPLGESLNMLASHGVYLRDVHLLNIGWHVSRDDDDWDRIVIFDPGHTPTAGGKDIEEALVENRRVYHGTPHVFAMGEATSSRGTYGPGFYFTTKLKEAEWYAESRKRLALVSPSALAAAGGIGEPTIVECDVDLRAPLHYFDVFPEEQSGPQPFRDFSEDELQLRFLIRDEGAGSSIQQLQALGYDGIIVDLSRQKATDDRTYYIVFDPTSLVCERGLIGREAL